MTYNPFTIMKIFSYHEDFFTEYRKKTQVRTPVRILTKVKEIFYMHWYECNLLLVVLGSFLLLGIAIYYKNQQAEKLYFKPVLRNNQVEIYYRFYYHVDWQPCVEAPFDSPEREGCLKYQAERMNK